MPYLGITPDAPAPTIETAEIANGAVTSAKILDSNVTTAKIADNAVTTAKIPDTGVTKAKLATAVQTQIDTATTLVSALGVPANYATAAQGLTADAVLAGFKGRVLNGLAMSNSGSDATNDIVVATGSCISDDGTTVITLSSALTKQIDATFVAGTNAGGRVGTLANGTWHVFAICKAAGASPDIIIADSLSPTLPSTYTKKKRIGSIIRASATILGFNQYGNEFVLKTPILDYQTTPANGAITTAISVPSGIKVKASMNAMVGNNGAVIIVYSPDGADLTPNVSIAQASACNIANATSTSPSPVSVWTNTSSQIKFNSGGNPATILTFGWLDLRE